MKSGQFSRVRSILVPVDGSQPSLDALAAACDIARECKAAVSVFHVIEVPRSLALDAEMGSEIERGEQILTDAEAVAREHRIKLEGELLKARQAGHAIVDEAKECGVDAIALGLGYEQPAGKFELGEFPRYVLQHALCDVWLFRYAPSNGSAEAPA